MANIYRWAQFTFPYSGTRLWGWAEDGGFNSTGSVIPPGYYKPKILQASRPVYGGLDLGNSLRLPEMAITLDDCDDDFGTIIGTNENALRAAVTVKAVAIENGAVLDSMSFTGVLASWSLTSDKVYQLTLRSDDTVLGSTVKKPIRPEDWPLVPVKTTWGTNAPIIIGLHDSAGITNTGACPVTHVDNVNFYGLVSWGWVTVLRAYQDNVRVAAGTAPFSSVVHLVRGGQMWTLLKFTSDQSAHTWTADVQGVESVGDGSGTALNNAGECMLWFLRNLAFGTPKRGLWLTSGGNLETADFTLATMALRAGGNPYKVSRLINSDTTVVSEVNGWGASCGLFPYVSPAGNIGVMFHDPQEKAVNWNNGSRWYRDTEKDFDRMELAFDQSGIIGGSLVTANSLATGGVGWQPLAVMNPFSKSGAVEGISMSWGPSFQ
jgi:hypothetical protein